ncbi:hypothetical protein DTL21_21470 [Bremerella cremea]|uniref:Uncharacterized protein n=1 Tax=Blastopirellula marina TaxID=124 RepID=A0A2S8FKQ4_9BACT|nr:hypothetical protein C5Y83_21450 [Blastopirellula marina]RCS45825.1 hypothetical protein DTL21_21470 [Bremerella cremea]
MPPSSINENVQPTIDFAFPRQASLSMVFELLRISGIDWGRSQYLEIGVLAGSPTTSSFQTAGLQKQLAS